MYNNSIIYKLICNDENVKDFYVGSTIDFKSRWTEHMSNCNNINCCSYNTKVYRFIRDNGGIDNWNMVVIEKYPVRQDIELRMRECYWFDILEPPLNTYRPYLTPTERKEYIKKYRKEYYKKNREKLKTDASTYNFNNHEKYLNYQKEYYKKNNDKLKEKITCICKCIISRSSYNKHLSSKKHFKKLEKLETILI